MENNEYLNKFLRKIKNANNNKEILEILNKTYEEGFEDGVNN